MLNYSIFIFEFILLIYSINYVNLFYIFSEERIKFNSRSSSSSNNHKRKLEPTKLEKALKIAHQKMNSKGPKGRLLIYI